MLFDLEYKDKGLVFTSQNYFSISFSVIKKIIYATLNNVKKILLIYIIGLPSPMLFRIKNINIIDTKIM
jgi:hypothetical protein